MQVMKLVTFDEAKNITSFEECKLEFNGSKKYLILKMVEKAPEETITSSFNRIYICKNTFLCCMDQDSTEAAVMMFSTKENCEKIYNAIVKVKSRESQPSNIVAINEDKMFKDHFYIPLIKAVQSGIKGHDVLKAILLDFINSCVSDERIYYLNVLTEILLLPSPEPSIMKESLQVVEEVVSPALDTSSYKPVVSSSRTSFGSSLSYGMRKRSINNISYKSESTPTKICNVSCFNEPVPRNSPEDVDFDIVEYRVGKTMDKKLLVFTSNERKELYEFIYVNLRKSWRYRCIQCWDQNKLTVIKATIHDDGSKTLDFNQMEHVCKAEEYSPEKYQSSVIIKSPNFKFVKREINGKLKPCLIIFDSGDNNMCYKFGFDSFPRYFFCLKCKDKGRSLTARFIQQNGKIAFEFNRLQHLCKPQKYFP